jgi:predicted RND superfamily exporter protein
MKRFFEFVAGNKAAVLVLLILAGVLSSIGAARVKTDNSLDVWFVEKDPVLERYKYYQDVFGSDEKIGVMARNNADLPEKEFELDVLKLQNNIKKLGDVESAAGPFDLPGKPSDFFFSKDKKAVTMIVSIKNEKDAAGARTRVINGIREEFQKNRIAGVKTELAGSGVIFDELNRISNADAGILIGLSYIVMIIIMALGGRSVYSIVIGLGSIGLSTLFYFGILGFFGSGINMVNMCVPSLMLILTIENFVYIGDNVLNGVEDLRSVDRKILAEKTGEVFWPAFVAFFTTILGFLSLVLCNMKIIRDFGILASAGLTAAFITAYLVNTLCFDLLIRMKVPMKSKKTIRNYSGLLGFLKRNSRTIMAVSVAICALALWGLTLLKSDTYSLGYLKKGNPVRMESEAIEKDFGYYLALDMVLKPEKGTCISKEYLAAIRKFRDDVSSLPEIKDSLGVYDYLAQYEAMKAAGLPLKGTGFYSMITPDEKMAKITFQVKMESSSGIEKTLSAIAAFAKKDLPPAIKTEPCGYLPLYVKMMKYVDDVQRSSFPWAFVTIMIVIGISLGSWRLALLSIFPNLFPIAVTMGAIGFLGIPLDVATITIASIAMGIVGDNAIHMMFVYKKAVGTEEEKWMKVFDVKLNSAVFNYIILGIGYAVFAFSHVNSIAYFGIFSAAMIFFVWLGDIFVLPAQFFWGKGGVKNEK